ncbi:MAG: hypothetical protein MR051_07995 [Lentisphaeria bacterium]|nr:hypothetical protein [Lentisphaeria bacterium]
MKRIVLSLLAAGLIGGGIGGFLYWKSDRRQVARLLEDALQLVRRTPGAAPHEGILKYAALDRIVTEPVKLYSERPYFVRELSRSECRGLLAFVHRQLRGIAVETEGVHIHVAGGAANFSFDAEITAEFRGRTVDIEVVTVRGEAVKHDGRWRISAVTLEPVLRR